MKATIIELMFLAILIICAWNGYKKGLIMGIGGVLAIIVAIYGATLVSSTFSYEVVPALRPFAAGYVETRTQPILYELLGYEADENGDYNVTYSVEDLLEGEDELARELCAGVFESIGVYSGTARTLANESLEYRDHNEVGIVEAMTQVACLRLTYAVGLVLAFALIAIALTVIGNIPNFSFKIPYMGLFNDITGAVMGIITGMILCAVLAWTLKFAGMVLPEETVAGTKLAGWFLRRDFMLKYFGL